MDYWTDEDWTDYINWTTSYFDEIDSEQYEE